MKYAPKLSSPFDRNGVWGPVTATLDWCEDNYEYSPYFAEFWNTVSNIAMILPACAGLWQVYSLTLERRFAVCFFTLGIVGCGSWMFHATLSHSMQLVDELSMLFTVSIMLYIVLESRTPVGQTNKRLAFLLFSACVSVSAAYLAVAHPLFHQVAYIGMVAVLVLCAGLLVREHPCYMRLFVGSVLVFSMAMLCWEIDVHGCYHLRKARTALNGQLPSLSAVTSGLTQFHAWWHVLAGLGTYGHMLTLSSTRSVILGRPHDVTYRFGLFPVLTEDAKAGKGM